MRRTILLGLLALSCLPKQSFWAYYNSFYNCQKNFGKAEGLYRKGKSSEANQYYRKAIEKGSRILKYYPRSAYVDDALFIIGVSHLRMDDVAKAQRKFEELLLYYPASPFAARTHLYLGKAYLESGRYRDALDQLSKAVAKDPKLESEAMVFKAEALLGAGEPSEAVKVISEFMKKYPKSPHKKEAYLVGAKAAKGSGRYDDGAAFLRELLSGFLTDSERVEVKILLGDIYYAAGDYSEAAAIYGSVDLAPGSPLIWPLLIKKGLAAEGLGRTDEAISFYKSVTEGGGYEFRAEAYYRMGLIYEGADSFSLAQELYSEAGKLTQGNYPILARRRLDALREWETLKDSSSVAKRYRYAEVSYLYLKRYDEASAIFAEIAEKYPKTDYAPKSMYALMHYQLRVRADTAAAREQYARLQEKYPKTLYSAEARRLFGDVLGTSAGSGNPNPGQ
ncbi:MAG: tetratricopeptide repeat protein [candidate division WOR-3 bacterium]